MKTMMFAVALTIALPGTAFAQAAPAQNSMGNMQGMNMSDKSMSGMNMQHMSCKDMHTMMAKGHSMHMSKAQMDKMCPKSKTAPRSAASKTHHRHSH